MADRAEARPRSRVDRHARGVRIVAWLLAEPGGRTVAEVSDHFRWSPRSVSITLADLAQQQLVVRVGRRYVAARDATTRVTRTD